MQTLTGHFLQVIGDGSDHYVVSHVLGEIVVFVGIFLSSSCSEVILPLGVDKSWLPYLFHKVIIKLKNSMDSLSETYNHNIVAKVI